MIHEGVVANRSDKGSIIVPLHLAGPLQNNFSGNATCHLYCDKSMSSVHLCVDRYQHGMT